MSEQKQFNLDKWKDSGNYLGPDWSDYYIGPCTHHRDSDLIDESNWDVMIRELEDGDYEGWEIVRDGHWAVGWIEWVAVEPEAEETLKFLSDMMDRKESYPLLDEDDHSQKEWKACEEAWEYMDKTERRDYLVDRLDCFKGTFRQLRAAINGSWHDAVNLLPSPSDILY